MIFELLIFGFAFFLTSVIVNLVGIALGTYEENEDE